MIPRPDVLIGNQTHVGMERSVNQDYYGWYEPESDEEFDRHGRLIVVCDGMGGHAGGEVASQLATTTIIETYRQDQSGNVLEALRHAIEQANRCVWDRAQADPNLKGMGTTVVTMVLKQGMAYFGHVGDSRCYLVRGGQLHAMTLDHSLVQQMVNEGLLREEDMENHPEKNVILRSLGVKPEVDVELTYQPYQTGDIYLLASDGLTGLVSKDECLQISSHLREQPMQACAQLIDLANRYGGYDNITVQMVHVKAMSAQEAVAMGLGGSPPAEAAKMGPSQTEMAANTQAHGSGSSVTGVVSAEEVAKIKAQLQAQQAAAGGAKAQARRSGGGMGTPVVAGIGIAAIALGIFGGTRLAAPTIEARAELMEMRGLAKAQASQVDFHKADLAAQKAIGNSKGLLGAFTGEKDLRAATEGFKKLVDPKAAGRSESGEDLDAVRDRALKAKADAEADGVNARENASIEFSRAEDSLRKATEAGDDAAKAVQHYRDADGRFREARERALDSLAAQSFKLKESSFRDSLYQAEQARAAEHIAELLDEAKHERDNAQQLLDKGEPRRAVQRMDYAIFLTKAATRLAPEIEKKK